MKHAKQRQSLRPRQDRPIGYYRNRPALVRAYLASGDRGTIFDFNSTRPALSSPQDQA